MLMLGEGGSAAPDEEYIMLDSGASRATCPASHAPSVPLQAASEGLDIRAADDRKVAHYGEKMVTYAVPEADGVQQVGIQWQVAGV